MKRSLMGAVVALVAIVIALLILYQAGTEARFTAIQPVQDGTILVTVQIDADAGQLAVSIQNNGSHTVIYGASFEVQVKGGNGWVKFFEPEVITAIGYELAPGETATEKIELISSMNLKTNDVYRFVKEIEGKYYSSGEFTIEDKGEV